MAKDRLITIPILNENTTVSLFPDEIPTGEAEYYDLINVLRAELAPLETWRNCAVEYYRQGFRTEFENVLSEIVESLSDPLVEKMYSEKPTYKERLADIYNALAGYFLNQLSESKSTSTDDPAAIKFVNYLRKSEDYARLNEYTWLMKGFYELRIGS